MKVVVISPEGHDPRERGSLAGFIAAGLPRYHVRKPSWSETELETWILELPSGWHPHLVLHQHHGLVAKLGLLGTHDRDTGLSKHVSTGSRSCHDMDGLLSALGKHPYVIFGPVFPSLTKPGYGPEPDYSWAQFKKILASKRAPGSTQVLAIGGITAEVLPYCASLGFDGVAALGSIWTAADPVAAYMELRRAADIMEATTCAV
ncbi:MAG TPA: thiamine phosphate synthase [Opitutaceae bacterium]|nr:thiamine phosphate synthase [Opitutaceae bacterium]